MRAKLNATQRDALRSVATRTPGTVEHDGRTMRALHRRGLVRRKTLGAPPWQQVVWVVTVQGQSALATMGREALALLGVK